MCALRAKKWCLTVGCFMLASTIGAKIMQNRIIGGQEAKKSHNFMASIMLNTFQGCQHICGGSIISERVVLTAAHCLNLFSAYQLRVHAGEKSVCVIHGEVHEVKDVLIHEKYNETILDYDVALVWIEGAFSSSLRPVRLATPMYEIVPGTFATILGWGVKHTDDIPQYLMAAKVPLISEQKCRSLLPLTKRMLCAGFIKGGVDSCEMDSGGPLLVKNVQIGIVSWGDGCGAANKPGVYTSVSHIYEWIRDSLSIRNEHI